MRSGIVITFPEGKDPVARHFASYQEARELSSKLRAEGKISHELWSSGVGRERRQTVGSHQCVNMETGTPTSADWVKDLAAKQQQEYRDQSDNVFESLKTNTAELEPEAPPAKGKKAKGKKAKADPDEAGDE